MRKAEAQIYDILAAQGYPTKYLSTLDYSDVPDEIADVKIAHEVAQLPLDAVLKVARAFEEPNHVPPPSPDSTPDPQEDEAEEEILSILRQIATIGGSQSPVVYALLWGLLTKEGLKQLAKFLAVGAAGSAIWEGVKYTVIEPLGEETIKNCTVEFLTELGEGEVLEIETKYNGGILFDDPGEIEVTVGGNPPYKWVGNKKRRVNGPGRVEIHLTGGRITASLRRPNCAESETSPANSMWQGIG